MLPSDLRKTREITFTRLPPEQVEQALQLLNGVEGLEVRPGTRPHTLTVTYNVRHYTLEGLENALSLQGFHLDNSLLLKLRRALVYYCENVQRENLNAPEPQQKARKIFAQAYEHHPHGDHDDTPAEWREYR